MDVRRKTSRCLSREVGVRGMEGKVGAATYGHPPVSRPVLSGTRPDVSPPSSQLPDRVRPQHHDVSHSSDTLTDLV